MKMIVCLDDRGGMMFNRRRQSRDRKVIRDIEKYVSNGELYITKYSEMLFSENDNIYTVVEDFKELDNGQYAFFEDRKPSEYKENLTQIIIYRWNRRYPFDMSFDIDLEKEGFCLAESIEFEGNSHEKITKEIFVR